MYYVERMIQIATCPRVHRHTVRRAFLVTDDLQVPPASLIGIRVSSAAPIMKPLANSVAEKGCKKVVNGNGSSCDRW